MVVQDSAEYSRLLHRGDIVVFTATYEFFCESIMEAVYCDRHPILPARLHHPELIPDCQHHPLLHVPLQYENEDELFWIHRGLLRGESRPLPKALLRSIKGKLYWSRMAPEYDERLEWIAGEPLHGGI